MHMKSCLWLSLFCAPQSVRASAQDPALHRPVPDHTAAEAGESDEDEDPMAWLGLGVKVGIASNGKGELDNPTYIKALPEGPGNRKKLSLDSRTGLQIAVPVNLGGDGIGLLIEPSITFVAIEGVNTTTGKKKDYGVTVLSAYLGPNLNLHPLDALYLGVGAGLKFGYATSDIYEFGVDIVGRIPVTATYYLLSDLAVLVDFGFGYGLSGYAAKSFPDPTTGKTRTPDLQYAGVSVWDLSVGIRWP